MQFSLIRKSVFSFFFFCCVLQAQSQESPPPPMKEDPNASAWKEPTSSSQTEWTAWKDEHFQISYPPKWYAASLEEPNSVIGFYSPNDSENDIFREFVSIYKTNVVFKGSTAELGQKMEQFIKEQFPEAKLVLLKLIEINSIEAAELTFIGSMGETSKNRLIIFNTDRAIYTVDMLYETSTANKYEGLFSEMVKTIHTF